MSIQLLFWILMLFWLLFGLYHSWGMWPIVGGNVLLWVVIALLGWKTFGPMVHG